MKPEPIPTEDPEDLQPQYVDEAFEEDPMEEEIWANASPLRAAQIPHRDASPPKSSQPLSGNAEPNRTPSKPTEVASTPVSNRPGAAPSASPNLPAHPPQRYTNRTGFKQSPQSGRKQNLRPAPQRKGAPFAEKLSDDRVKPATTSNPKSESEGSPGPGNRLEGSSKKTSIPEWYRLDEVIRSFQPLPEGSLILGIDEEGRPLVLELSDFSTGALIILGDNVNANRKHMLAVLASSEKINNADLLQMDVISPSKSLFSRQHSSMRTLCAPEENSTFTLLGELLTDIEKRLRDQRSLPFRLLILDQVDELVSRMAEDSQRYLRWILRRGPQVGIWPIATLDTHRLGAVDLKTFRSFGLRLFGKIEAAEQAKLVTDVPAQVLRSLSPGSQGCFKLDGATVSFTVPDFS